MRRIFKYDIEVAPVVEHQMPRGAVVVHVAVQSDPRFVQMWALVDDEAPTVKRRFFVIGTGMAVPDEFLLDGERASYRGTALAAERRLVWHLFEIKS